MDLEIIEGLPFKSCKVCGEPTQTNSDYCNICYKIQKLSYERDLYQKLRKDRLVTGLCVECGKNKAVIPGTRCAACRAKRAAYTTAKRKKYVANGKCNNCGASPVSETCKDLCEPCRQVNLTRAREIAHKNKITVMAHYGQGICNCCSEDILEFLTIDHIEGRGSRHRTSLFNSRDACGEKFYRWLIKNNFPPGYQVLCFNCNYGKHVNGICPHKTMLKNPVTWQQQYGQRLKSQAMAAYGNKCKCCQENCLSFLNIDHINGRTDKLRGDKLYRWLIKNNFPEGFQVLCFNCNVSKYLSGTCIHNAAMI